MITEDAEVQMCLDLMADKLRAKGKDTLAFKIENLIELLTEELTPKVRKKS